MSCLRCLCACACGGVPRILCCVFVLFFFVLCALYMLPISLDCPLFIATSVISNFYLYLVQNMICTSGSRITKKTEMI